jgi:protoheme ferro-lyase
MKNGGASPLLEQTRKQAEALEKKLSKKARIGALLA